MTTKTIGELTAATLPLDGTEKVELENAGGTLSLRCTTADIADLVPVPSATETFVDQSKFSGKNNYVGTGQYKSEGLTISALSSGSFSSLSPGTNLIGTFRYAVDTSPGGSADRQAAHYGTQTSEYVYRRASGSALGGGFTLVARAIPLTVAANQRSFLGMGSFAGSIMTQTQEPSAQIDCAFFGKDAADTNLFFMHNDGSGSCTKVDSGVAFSTLIGHILDIELSCDAGGTTLTYLITDRNTGTVLMDGTASTNLPTADVGLLPAFIANTGSQTTAVSIGYSHARIATSF